MITFLIKIYYRLFPLEMVQWWKSKEAVAAKVTRANDGSYEMWMEGEKYPFAGYPRGHLLFGSLSVLKHNLKVKLFNDSWWKLERGESPEKVVYDIKTSIVDEILTIGEQSKYDMLQIEKNVPAVREIYRAWTIASGGNQRMLKLRDIICFIFNEDDAYRMRFQWVIPYFKKLGFEKGMNLLEDAEVVEDMKDRIRLIKRIVGLLIESDPTFWNRFIKELDVSKARLSKADKYYFRAKYFKTDYKNPDSIWGRASNNLLY